MAFFKFGSGKSNGTQAQALVIDEPAKREMIKALQAAGATATLVENTFGGGAWMIEVQNLPMKIAGPIAGPLKTQVQSGTNGGIADTFYIPLTDPVAFKEAITAVQKNTDRMKAGQTGEASVSVGASRINSNSTSSGNRTL